MKNQFAKLALAALVCASAVSSVQAENSSSPMLAVAGCAQAPSQSYSYDQNPQGQSYYYEDFNNRPTQGGRYGTRSRQNTRYNQDQNWADANQGSMSSTQQSGWTSSNQTPSARSANAYDSTQADWSDSNSTNRANSNRNSSNWNDQNSNSNWNNSNQNQR